MGKSNPKPLRDVSSGGTKLKAPWKSVDEFRHKARVYFQGLRDMNDENWVLIPTAAGLALDLGLTGTKELRKYAVDEKWGDEVERALSKIDEYHEERLSEKACQGSIMYLRSRGYEDQSKTVVNSGIEHRVHRTTLPQKKPVGAPVNAVKSKKEDQ